MRIALIGPGGLPIPPQGWGAVERVIHEIAERVKQRGHDVLIVNTKDTDDIVRQVNGSQPDFVHLHFDRYHAVLAEIECPHKAITSHHSLLERTAPNDDYATTVHGPIAAMRDVHIFALSEAIAANYVRFGAAPARLRVLPNGVDVDAFRFSAMPRFPNRSICLGRIGLRKRQAELQAFGCEIDFVGPVSEPQLRRRKPKRWSWFRRREGFDTAAPDYLGEWTREEVRERLTDYANLVLLSQFEAHSLACMEGLAAGLGLVVSERATAHLDLSKPFIDVIPESRIKDRGQVRATVRANRAKSVAMREEIRAYARQFDWERVIDRYCEIVAEICRGDRCSQQDRA